jgi:hypothetical protein
MTNDSAAAKPQIAAFADLMAAANASKHPRTAGQWTGEACRVWREAAPEMSRLLEAAIAWEMVEGRVARPEDEPAVRARRQKMDDETSALKTVGAA